MGCGVWAGGSGGVGGDLTAKEGRLGWAGLRRIASRCVGHWRVVVWSRVRVLFSEAFVLVAVSRYLPGW